MAKSNQLTPLSFKGLSLLFFEEMVANVYAERVYAAAHRSQEEPNKDRRVAVKIRVVS